MSVVVDCPRCHRPLFPLEWDGTHARIMGTVLPENGDPTGTLTSYSGGRVKWAGRVTSTDPALAPGSSSGLGRKTIRHVCAHRREPSRVVTQAALDASYQRATAAGLDRVSLRHVTADVVQD